MRKQPDQMLYDHAMRSAQALGFAAYTDNPPEGAAYPFVLPGQVQILPRATKGGLMGSGYVVIDVWGGADDRRLISDMAGKLLERIGDADAAEGYRLFFLPGSSSIELMPDNSTNHPLWRARLGLTINFI